MKYEAISLKNVKLKTKKNIGRIMIFCGLLIFCGEMLFKHLKNLPFYAMSDNKALMFYFHFIIFFLIVGGLFLFLKKEKFAVYSNKKDRFSEGERKTMIEQDSYINLPIRLGFIFSCLTLVFWWTGAVPSIAAICTAIGWLKIFDKNKNGMYLVKYSVTILLATALSLGLHIEYEIFEYTLGSQQAEKVNNELVIAEYEQPMNFDN